ncbi:unnamed protein product [Polarella glacialis]|uniref:Uncharacterized protein n=1 Tax=Polarella glacialis TaxID=89957 RepID=A0A813LWY1_POLGL|nr:unnamed protein product [Polarella glacialis]
MGEISALQNGERASTVARNQELFGIHLSLEELIGAIPGIEVQVEKTAAAQRLIGPNTAELRTILREVRVHMKNGLEEYGNGARALDAATCKELPAQLDDEIGRATTHFESVATQVLANMNNIAALSRRQDASEKLSASSPKLI